MNEIIENKVKKWFDENIHSISMKNPVSVHLDDLLGNFFKKDIGFKLSLECFDILINMLDKEANKKLPLLV